MTELGERAYRLALERRDSGDKLALRARGVVATPLALARAALVRADALLKSELGLPEGLASGRALFVDPAVGTGIWLAALLELTRGRTAPDRALLGIDVQSDSLAAAASVLGREAEAQGVRLELCAENTLERARVLAAADERVLVIVGNPPWAARSLSRGGTLSDRWLEEFRRDHAGAPLGERRSGVLSDDYVRFFGWSLEQARLARAGSLLCLATNGSYVDGPVHRGMRAALVGAFDRIELLDLGGSALLSREARSDENVFGVRVAAALGLFVRRAGEHERRASVSYARLSGSRDEKLAALAHTPEATVHTPSAPWFSLRPSARVPVDEDSVSLAQAMPFHREGVQTNRDALCIARSPAALRRQLEAFSRGELNLPGGRHFDVARARAQAFDLLARGEIEGVPLAYRPLDGRYLLTCTPLCHRPRPELLRAVARSELSLLSVRKERGALPYNLFAASGAVADACFLSARSSCRTRVFPSHTEDGSENLAEALRETLSRRGVRGVTSRAFVAYALGRLGSPGYRALHDEQLKLDYPRVPLPRDDNEFRVAVSLGERFTMLLDPGASPEEGPFTLHAERHEQLPPDKLRYDPDTQTLSVEKRVLASSVPRAAVAVSVGHHTILTSALRACEAPSMGALRDALARAHGWLAAEREADRLFERSGAR